MTPNISQNNNNTTEFNFAVNRIKEAGFIGKSIGIAFEALHKTLGMPNDMPSVIVNGVETDEFHIISIGDKVVWIMPAGIY